MSCTFCASSFAQSKLIVDSIDGGKARLTTGFAYINMNAKLNRIFWVINNPDCPIKLSEAGLKPKWKEVEGFWYEVKGKAIAKQKIQAIQVNFFAFSVFDKWISAHNGTEIIEMESGKEFSLKKLGRFPANWKTFHYFFQTVAYVSRVRLDNNEIWEQDYEEIKNQILELGLEEPGHLTGRTPNP